MSIEINTVDAKHGEKMIEINIRFWTNDLAGEKGKILQKHAWTSGVVTIERNEAHDITPFNPLPFHSLMDISSVIEKVLVAQGIILHPGRKMNLYLTDE